MEYVFSISMMKSCGTHTQSDLDYFSFFINECERRIRSAVGELKGFTDGSRAFDVESEGRVKVALAEVRRAEFAIDSCCDWFGSTQIGQRFLDLRGLLREETSAAEECARRLDWFFRKSEL